MNTSSLKIIINKLAFSLKQKSTIKGMLALLFCVLTLLKSKAQEVSASIDSTTIIIGNKITYSIHVKTDTSALVVFPEKNNSFLPLELLETYKTDTTKIKSNLSLIKSYALTQFDSGSYTIPRQKLNINNTSFYTDSISLRVNPVVVDTTKQGLYDIKPIITVNTKKNSSWWYWLIIALIGLLIVAMALYWFIWRKKPLTEEQKIALLPPYERAKIALKKLDESDYLNHYELKDYYSELTLIIRKYLNDKVYDHALESTTNELINRLRVLSDGNQIDLSKESIRNIEDILKRADLVKFAKSAPDLELAQIDRTVVDTEIDHVKEALPEPTEEEKLLDQQYKEAQDRKKKRRKIILTASIIGLLIIATYIAFSLRYGFVYVKDTLLGDDSLELLEGEWITSDYSFPPITLSTPKVLKRIENEQTEDLLQTFQTTIFAYNKLTDYFSVTLNTTIVNSEEGEEKSKIDIQEAAQQSIKSFEEMGVKDMILKSEKFTTPKASEGHKTFGTAKFPSNDSGTLVNGEYVILHFVSGNIIHQLAITWREDDSYTEEIANRVLDSVELITSSK